MRPQFRKLGVATALIRGFIQEARNAGAFEVWVLTNRSNRAAMSLYAHCGLRRENSDDVMLNLKMERKRRRR